MPFPPGRPGGQARVLPAQVLSRPSGSAAATACCAIGGRVFPKGTRRLSAAVPAAPPLLAGPSLDVLIPSAALSLCVIRTHNPSEVGATWAEEFWIGSFKA